MALKVLVFSDDAEVRRQVCLTLGTRPSRELDEIDYVEAATHLDVTRTVDGGGVDLVILDGEAWPAGGMGVARELKDEIRDCPPVLLLIARRDDRWLARWSRADAVQPYPLDALSLSETATKLLRDRLAGLPVLR